MKWIGILLLLAASTISGQQQPTDSPVTNETTTTLSTASSTTVTSTTESTSTSTTSESTTTETTTTLQPTLGPPSVPQQSELFCTCDLTIGHCDVSCCCDPDCSPDDRLLFTRCWAPPVSHFHRHYCSPLPPPEVAWNNTAELQHFRTEFQPQSGLFCIIKDNVPKKKLYEDMAPVSNDDMVQRVLPKVIGRWVDGSLVTSSSDSGQTFYKKGAPIFVLDANGARPFKLPSSLNSATCNVARTINFLEPGSHQCYLRGPCDDPILRPESILANLSVFRLPPQSSSSGGDKSVVPVVVRICKAADDCRSDLSVPSNCSGSLASVTLRFGFNGTQGITYVLADLLYPDPPVRPSGLVTFETVFQSLTDPSLLDEPGSLKQMIRSGNPGYQLGKPLVVARFNATGGDGEYQSLLLFPGSEGQSRRILFGQDTFQVLRVDKNVTEAANRSEWCSSQWRSFVLSSFWGQNVTNWRLGVYGNAQLNDSTQWLPLQIPHNAPDLPCLSRSIRAELVVLYVRSGAYDQPQNKLLNAVLYLKADGSDTCPSGEQRCTFQLTQSVAFIRADVSTTMILPEPPRWRVQLPRDFFYPFLLSSSPSSSIVNVHFYVTVSILSTLSAILSY